MSPIAQSTTALAHEVRLVHASTGAPLTCALVPALLPYGWAAGMKNGTCVVTARDDAVAGPGHIGLVLADAREAALLDLAALTAGETPGSLRVALTSPVREIPVPAVAMVLTVELVDHTTGAPTAGATVTMRPTLGTSVPLPELGGQPGTYQSAALVWGAEFTPADLRVGSTTVRKVSMDFTRIETRVRVIDPT